MKLLVPSIFEPFPEVVAAMSLRDKEALGGFSMLDKGTDEETARINREQFCQELGFKSDRLALPRQTHSADIHVVENEYRRREGDAVISSQKGWLLGVSVADCVAVLLYEPESGFYAAIHSGWRGSAQDIAGASIAKAVRSYRLNPSHILAWVSPAAGADSYEVGYDVAGQFNQRYSQPKNKEKDTWLFDNKSVVRDQLLNSGLTPDHIETSNLDTITNQELHSARRDGASSGRMLAAIGVIGT